MSERLTQEELLGRIGGAIAIAKEYWEEMDGMSKEDDARLASNVLRLEQAYQQIKELIENYNEVQAFAMEIIEGKRATKEWVYDRVDKELKECGYEDSPARPASYEIKGMIVDILTELGVEVSDE